MILRLAVLLLLIVTPAHAWLVQGPPSVSTTVQVLTATSNGAIAGTAHNLSFSYDGVAIATSASGLLTVFPSAGTLSNFRFSVVGGVTGAQTWPAEIVKNGATNVIGCTVNATTNPCSTAGPVAISANDTAILVITPTGSPTAAVLQVTVDYTPTHAGDTILPAGASAAFNTTTVTALSLMSSFAPGGIANRNVNLLAEAGTIDLLTAATNAPGGSASYAYDVGKNATASGVFVCGITGAAVDCQDTTHSITNADGDNVEYVGTPTATPTGALGGWATRWTPATSGDFPFVATGLYTSDSATATEFWTLGGVMNATESSAQSLVNNMTVTKIEVKLPSAPGVGKSRTFTLRDNGADISASACAISGAVTTSCTITFTGSFADGDLASISDIPSGSPSAVHPAIGLIAHR